MAEIENINNLTLAELIEIWEFCNGAEDCRKCPLKDTNCAKILHTATLEALKNLVQLVDLQKEEIEDFKRLTTIQRGREYYNKFVTEVFQKERNNDLIYPDFDEIYKRYFEQKAEIARLESDCKTLSAVLSKDVESDKEAVTAFIGFLEENAKIEVFKRPKIKLDCEAKFLYIDDIKRLEKEFWEGDEQC